MCFDLAQGCADSLAHRHTCPLCGGAGSTSASVQTDRTPKLGKECLALRSELDRGVLVATLVCHIELTLYLAEAIAVRGKREGIENLARVGLVEGASRQTRTSGRKFKRWHVRTRPLQQI